MNVPCDPRKVHECIRSRDDELKSMTEGRATRGGERNNQGRVTRLKVLSEVSSSRAVVVVPGTEVEVRGVAVGGREGRQVSSMKDRRKEVWKGDSREVSEVGSEEGRGGEGHDVGGEGVGLDGQGSDDTGEGEDVGEGDSGLSEAEEDGGVGEVESERDPVL